MKTPQKFRAEILTKNRCSSTKEFRVGEKLRLRFSEHHYIWHEYTLNKDGWFIKDKDD